jgi:hypothetical protein
MNLFKRLFGRTPQAAIVREVRVESAADDVTCDQPTPEAVKAFEERIRVRGKGDFKGLPQCGEPATTTETVTFKNSDRDHVMNYCQKHWEAKQRIQEEALQQASARPPRPSPRPR